MQVLHFLNWQLKRPELPRKTAALNCATGFGRAKHVAERILRQERTWVQTRTISHGNRGKHIKAICMLEDEGTMIAVREYLENSGESIVSPSLVV
jgi:hypothetical protein